MRSIVPLLLIFALLLPSSGLADRVSRSWPTPQVTLSQIRQFPPVKQVDALTSPGVFFLIKSPLDAATVIDMIDHQELDAQARILEAEENIEWLSSNGQSPASVLRLIGLQKPPTQGSILAAEGAVVGLAQAGKASEVIKLIQDQPPETQSRILANYDVVFVLCAQGKCNEAMTIIAAMTVPEQAAILEQEDVVYNLVNDVLPRGHGADEVMRLLRSAPSAIQARILGAYSALPSLDEFGKAPEVLAILAKLPTEDQLRILAQYEVALSLADNKSCDFLGFVEKQSPNVQASLLARNGVVGGMARTDGDRGRIIAMIDKFSPQDKAAVLAAAGAPGALSYGTGPQHGTVKTEIDRQSLEMQAKLLSGENLAELANVDPDHLLAMFKRQPVEVQGNLLLKTEIIERLPFGGGDSVGRMEAILAALQSQPPETQWQILTLPFAIYYIVPPGDAGAPNANTIMRIVTAAPTAWQVDILCAPETVSTLARFKADEVVALIRALPVDAQAKLVTSPYGLYGLATFGKANEALALIAKQSLEVQKAVGGVTLLNLVEYGSKTKEVLALIGMKQLDNQAVVLDDPSFIMTLAKNGGAAGTMALLKRQPPDQREKIMGRPELLQNIVRQGLSPKTAEDLDDWRQSKEQSRPQRF